MSELLSTVHPASNLPIFTKDRSGRVPESKQTSPRRFIKASSWNGKSLKDSWLVTFKIDGVRAIWHETAGWQSRANKPLYNIPSWQPGQPRDCEIWLGSFRQTIQATRTRLIKQDTPIIRPDHLYGLDQLDPRLHGRILTNPTADDIRCQLHHANRFGFEGLVLRQGERWLKVKPEETHDVTITGFTEGRGQHIGRLGFISTSRGDVGSGFSDAERGAFWVEAQAGTLIGQVVEIACMEFTPSGQFRHPYFVRMRPDLPAIADLMVNMQNRERRTP